jgi:hypothetical protein
MNSKRRFFTVREALSNRRAKANAGGALRERAAIAACAVRRVVLFDVAFGSRHGLASDASVDCGSATVLGNHYGIIHVEITRYCRITCESEDD